VTSVSMVLLWFLGDSSRLLFYIYKQQPIQFYFGSGVAALLDFVVLGQIFFLKKSQRYEDI
jgi:PQ loop repeat